MRASLFEFAKRFALGELSALNFADEYQRRWKEEERDRGSLVSHERSDVLGSIFCLANLYDPNDDTRLDCELDEAQLRNRIAQVLKNVD
jgi:hypothetical protein